MQQSTVTLIVAGIGICGTLGGIVTGHLLTRSWQREQWLLDCRKEEFRELVSTLVRSYSTVREFGLAGSNGPSVQAESEALAIIQDRIYIVIEMQTLCVYERWMRIAGLVRRATGQNEAARLFHELNTDIVVAALNLQPEPSRWRRFRKH